jgi:hypothetical protein
MQMAADKKGTKEVVTREYTINLHKRLHGVAFKKKAPRAIKEIKAFAQKAMGTKVRAKRARRAIKIAFHCVCLLPRSPLPPLPTPSSVASPGPHAPSPAPHSRAPSAQASCALPARAAGLRGTSGAMRGGLCGGGESVETKRGGAPLLPSSPTLPLTLYLFPYFLCNFSGRPRGR